MTGNVFHRDFMVVFKDVKGNSFFFKKKLILLEHGDSIQFPNFPHPLLDSTLVNIHIFPFLFCNLPYLAQIAQPVSESSLTTCACDTAKKHTVCKY